MGVQPSFPPPQLSATAGGRRWLLASTPSRTVQLCCSKPAGGVLNSELRRSAYVKQVVPRFSVMPERRCLKQTLFGAKVFYFCRHSHGSDGVAGGLQDSRASGLVGQISTMSRSKTIFLFK